MIISKQLYWDHMIQRIRLFLTKRELLMSSFLDYLLIDASREGLR